MGSNQACSLASPTGYKNKAEAMTGVTQKNKCNKIIVNKARVWAACDAFAVVSNHQRIKITSSPCYLLKYISWSRTNTEHSSWWSNKNNMKSGDAMMAKQPLFFQRTLVFGICISNEQKRGNGERIDLALEAIENANGSKLKNVFQDIALTLTNSVMKKPKTNVFLKQPNIEHLT